HCDKKDNDFLLHLLGPKENNFYFMETPNNELIRERITLNKSAHQNPSTPKPGIISAAIITMNALITNKNKPNVNKVMGMVKKTNIGFMVRFSKANNAAMTIPVK